MEKTKSPRETNNQGEKKIIPLKSNDATPIPLYVGIGASAGGLEAIQAFFQNMPPVSPLAFIVIQHLSPDYKSLMVELLSKKTKMPVKRAEDGMTVEANTVYLIPPKKNLRIFHGKLLLSEQDYSRGINLPIDIFFHSLAEDQGERAAGIILSGTGSDGMRGIRAIKEQGGLVMVQKEQSAKFDGMPRSAISTGLADFVLAPEDMPDQLNSYVKHPYVTKSDRSPSIMEDENGLTRIFSMLRDRYKVDFTYYKPSTVTRRIERRMTVNQIVDINDYAIFAMNTPAEISILYRELLIGVTSFFRDLDAYQTLTDKWLPKIMDDPDQHELRFWVSACSTGEEAYSIAISARECMEKLGITKDIKIFATDIDRDAIARAGTGIYPESIAADISTKLLSKYFYRKDENFHIVRNIREMVVFAQHNIVKDPPFTQIDLVTCRNLLIYLQPVLQRKVLGMINFSLRPGGLLMLGLSETVGETGELFEMLDSRQKIYRSKGKSGILDRNGYLATGSPIRHTRHEKVLSGRDFPRLSNEERTLQRFVDALSGDYIPLAIVVNDQLELKHIIGDSTGFFRLPSGRPVNDISKLAAKELSIPLSTGIQKVLRTRKSHVFSNIQVSGLGHIQSIKMTIKPVPGKTGQENLVAVMIEEMAPAQNLEDDSETSTYDLGSEAEQYLRDMENELQFTRENLQATIEELETANEELQATNEELLASNEELQSTNEELQSTNEELHTVNVEYQNKIIELTELNNDVENLLTSSNVGKLLLDDNMEIRRFSARINDIFKVLDSDIGRPLTHLTHRLVNADPLELVETVAKTKKIIEKEVQTEDGRWYFMRVLPYQVGPDVYSGTVLSFIDITELITHRDELADKSNQYRDAQEIGQFGSWDFDHSSDELNLSLKTFDIFEIDNAAYDGSYTEFIKLVHPDDREQLDRDFKESITTKRPFNAVYRLLFKDGRTKFINAVCITEYDQSGEPTRTVGTVQDVTTQKKLETSLQIAEDEKALILDNISEAIIHLDLDRKVKWLNKSAAQMLGGQQQDFIGKECQAAWCLSEADCDSCPFAQTLKSGKRTQRMIEDSKGRMWNVQANPITDPNGDLIGVVEMRHPQ